MCRGISVSGYQWAPLPGNCLAARIADLTPDLQVFLSWGSTVNSLSPSVSFMLVWASLPPHLPSVCISHAVLTAPLELSTCPNQQSLISLKMRLRSSISSFTSSSLDLTVTTSSGLILQIYLIIALQALQVSSWSMAKFHWHGAWRSASKSCIHDHGSCKRDGRMRPLFHSLHKQKTCHPGSRRKLPPPAIGGPHLAHLELTK